MKILIAFSSGEKENGKSTNRNEQSYQRTDLFWQENAEETEVICDRTVHTHG